MLPNSSLTECSGLKADIQECQENGVAILIYYSSQIGWAKASAVDHANLLWDLVLGGSSPTRPFGEALLDGVVVEVDPTLPSTGLLSLVDQLRSLSEVDGKRYLWMAVTHCDVADDFSVADLAISSMTAFLVDVHSTKCSVGHYDNKTQWNYGVWDDWVSRQSLRSDFKLYLYVDSSDTVVDNDYANPSRLAQIASGTMTQYPRYFGGIAYYDAARAVSNDGFNVQLRKALSTLALSPASSSSSTGIPSAPVTTQNPLPSDGSKSHSSHTKLIVGITSPVLVIACTLVATLALLRRRRRRARRGDEDLRDSTGELIAPYPPPQHDTPDPWVRPVKWVERKSNSSLSGIPRDAPVETAQPVNAVQEQPQVLQNPEGLAALETEIGRVGLTVPALLASLGRLGTDPNAMSGDNVSEMVTDPPEYS